MRSRLRSVKSVDAVTQLKTKPPLSKESSLSVILIAVLLSIWGCSRPVVIDLPQLPPPKDAEIIKYEPGQSGGIFIETELGEISTLNPLVAEDASSSGAIALLLKGMTTWNPVKEEVVPSLAKSWEVGDDQKTFTFHLREGLVWSDGVPLTADDVIFTYQCIYDDRFPNRTRFFISINDQPCQVEKIDDLTVRITAPDIFAPFLLFVSGVDILPKHKLQPFVEDGTLLEQWSISTAKNAPQDIVSSGPFVMHSYRPGERIVFARNPNYYKVDSAGQRLPYTDYVILKLVKDMNASVIAFAQGQTDAEGITPDHVAWVKRGESTHDYSIVNRGPSTSTGFIWFNQNPGKDADGKPFVPPSKLKWFQNKRFRQAISYGINREGIVEGVLFGRGTPLYGSVSPANQKWHNPNVVTYPYNPKKAGEILMEEGFRMDDSGSLEDETGESVSFTLMTNKSNNVRTEMATIFKENMAELGIEVKLQFIDFGTLITKISDSFNYEASLLGLTGGAGDPAGGMDIYSSGGRLHMWYPQQKEPATEWEGRIDELMQLQLKTLDEKKRKEYFDEVQYLMTENVPFIYLVTPNSYVGLKNKWQNIEIPKIGSLIWNLDELWALEQ